ncbi:hypothetical protein O6H91_10G067700 [Diphasiastrum complanatum]|uniref:Uncharacterized protein n=1 Tax=Diphasiastrum complanatum TaxID=34168 RepID=A0ACC2CI47_DIPCM|nr:hypothetical protein O6H91_10G067700 [Diphasiastrum complanatum]
MAMAMEEWRFPQGRAVDAVRWLPHATAAMDRLLVLALWDATPCRPSIDLTSLCHQEQAEAGQSTPWLQLQVSWPQPARASALRVLALSHERVLVAAASVVGSLSLVAIDSLHPSRPSAPLICPSLHRGSMCGLDLQSSSQSCVSVGEDGKINIISFGESGLQPMCFYDNRGLLSFSAVRWASPVEFVTGGIGYSLQWWDTRRPGGAVSKALTKWNGRHGPGLIHSIDIHPSRKHICVIGGSAGSVLAWDLRWQQEPIQLVGDNARGKGNLLGAPPIESDVWEVKYDHFSPFSGHSADTGKASPVMVCSEDGVLAVLEDGVAVELLAEPCAINSFDIDPELGQGHS